MYRIVCTGVFLIFHFLGASQPSAPYTTHLAGVYQGKTLFVQNPYNPETKSYCVEQVIVNGEPMLLNYRMSAIVLNFDGQDWHTPVNVTIHHADSVCRPVIVNPEAVLFHTIFRFSSVSLSDTLLTWTTKGERGHGRFVVEKLQNGIWVEQSTMDAEGTYGGADYSYFPSLEEGHNKYRVKYYFPDGSRTEYLYSLERDYDYYPEPVAFRPKTAKTRLYLSRYTPYEIFNARSELVLSGEGSEIDVTVLSRGSYAIYFNGRDPGSFTKE